MRKTDEELRTHYAEQLSRFDGIRRELAEALILNAYVTGYLDALKSKNV